MSDGKNHFVQGMSRIADFWGMPKAMGAIYGCIYLAPEPIGLDELVAQTGYSKGSVSTNVRALERMQMIRRELKIGDRKDYYSADADLWAVVKGILEQRRKAEFSAALLSVNESLDMLDTERRTAEDIHRMAFQRERIQRMASFFATLDKIVGALLLVNKLSASNLKKTLKAIK